jgi:hypothetical protein
LAEYASAMQRELELGTNVCSAYIVLFTTDKDWGYRSDPESLRERLAQYVAKFGR